MAPATKRGEYTGAFYDNIARGCHESAEVVVPLILAAMGAVPQMDDPAMTVVDVGCGQGWWGAEFARYGCDVTGLDGDYVEARQIDRFIPHNLDESLPTGLLGRFDLAVCLEVAEHLPGARAVSFVADLCALSDTIVFSAAIPWQTGVGHVWCKWPSYWAGLFAEHGYGMDGAFRFQIWDDPRVECWYRQNLVIVRKGAATVGPLDVVCAEMHGWGR